MIGFGVIMLIISLSLMFTAGVQFGFDLASPSKLQEYTGDFSGKQVAKICAFASVISFVYGIVLIISSMGGI